MPGICSPEDMVAVTERLVLYCAALQQAIERAQGPTLVSLARRHHGAICWLRPAVQHCAAHHEDPEWRDAAERVAAALQALDDALSRQLAAHPGWAALSGSPASAQQFAGGRPDSASHAAAHQAGEAGGAERPTGAAAEAAAREAAPSLEGGGAASVQADAALELVQAGVARARALDPREARELAELEKLEQQLLAAFRAALSDPAVVPLPLLVLHGSEVAADPVLVQHAVPATAADVRAARSGGYVVLPLLHGGAGGDGGGGQQQGEQVAAMDGGPCATAAHARREQAGARLSQNEGAAAAAAAAPFTVELGPLAAATHAARTRGGRLWSVRLHGDLATLLLADHPSAHVRRAVHAVTYGAQAAAALRLMDVLRPLRDDIADCYNQPSYAHLRTAGSVAGSPETALRFLGDLLAAVKPFADEEVERLQLLLLRLEGAGDATSAQGRGRGGGPAGGAEWHTTDEADAVQQEEEPDLLDLVGSVDSLTSLQRPPPMGVDEWRDLAPAFSIQGVLSGLSTLLRQVLGLQLLPSQHAQHEAPCAPGHVLRLELRDAEAGAGTQAPVGEGGAEGLLRGVTYVLLDPDCDLPFTALVRYGCDAADPAPWLLPPRDGGEGPHAAAALAACVPHVAIHVPARSVARTRGGSLVPEHAGLVRTLVHEVGHALQYMLSYRPGALPGSAACHSSTDYVELASHILERWAADPGVLSDLAAGRVGGRAVPPRRCARLVDATTRQTTMLEVQQHALMAAADLIMHMNGHVDVMQLCAVQPLPPPPPSGPSAPSVRRQLRVPESPGNAVSGALDGAAASSAVLHVPSTPTLQLVSALWSVHSSLPGGAFQATRQVMALLPGLGVNAAAMFAYPMAQVVAAAVWEAHFAGGGLDTAAAARGGRLLRRVLFERGEASSAASALAALLGPGAVRTAADDGVRQGGGAAQAAEGACGCYPDLEDAAYQGVDLLVF